jgi:hypothetical protein
MGTFLAQYAWYYLMILLHITRYEELRAYVQLQFMLKVAEQKFKISLLLLLDVLCK